MRCVRSKNSFSSSSSSVRSAFVSSAKPVRPKKAAASACSVLAQKLRDDVAKAALGGSERSRERHVSRGKLLPRDRVELLLDPGSPFLELSQLAACDMYEGDVPGAGMIAGIAGGATR